MTVAQLQQYIQATGTPDVVMATINQAIVRVMLAVMVAL